MSNLGLNVKRIDCCEDGCMLYYKADDQLTKCKFYHRSRYLPHKGGTRRHKSVLVKKMFYLPLIHILQRLYASLETTKQMKWHYENKRYDGALRHPFDEKSWKHFDNVYPNFVADPWHIRLCLFYTILTLFTYYDWILDISSTCTGHGDN